MFKQSRPKKLFLLTNLWLLLALVFSISLAGLFNQAGHNRVEAATSSTINFQARLLSNSGALVPDGFYNAQFKLYSASSGGTAQWTETYYDSNGVTAGNDNRVRVVNGYLSVYLGSQTALPSIDWSQEEWLTINIGGTTQTATPTWDGEMSPRLKLSAVPYALTAGTLAKTTGANTSTLDWDTQTGANSILLPDESGTLCIQGSSNCGFATASGSGSYIQNGTSIQTAANFAIQSAASGSVGGVIQAAVGQTADIFRIEDSSGNALFAVGSSGGGLLKRSSTSQSALALKTISDTANRLNIQAGGTIEWGDGTNPTDTNLYRSAAGQLTTDGELIVADNLSTWGDFWADQTISSGDQICASQTGTAAEEVCIGNNIGPSFQAGIQIGGDTSIYRSAATTLNTDGSLVVGTAGTSHGLTVNGLLGSATFDTDGNGLYFSRDGSNYIEATDALGTLRLGAGGNSNNVVLGTNGDILFQNSTDSTAAFQVQGTGDQALLTVDTQNGQTIIRPPSGSGSGVGKLVINSNWTDGSGDEAQLLFGEAADVGASAGKLYYTGVNNTVHLSGLDASGVTHDVLTFDRSGAGVILQSTNTVNINSTGANNITLAPAGTTNTGVVVKPGVDSTKAFQVQYSDSTPLFTVDTQNGEVGIGTAGSLAGNELYVQSNSDTVIRGKNTGTADLLQLANSSANVFVVNNSGNLTTAGDIQIQGGDLTTNQTTFNLLAGATTALNIGPGSNTATSINLAGGSGATGCTVAGATGNLTCSGTISTTNTSGTVGFWTRNNGTALLQPATTGDSIRISNAGG
ncbi:MAG TPA: hypothetical protein VFW77_04400, partial [Candidatus Saccharimonadales bacterium]|nr:hypothetical protein [Candidatus Saccharimonadales bacterium]